MNCGAVPASNATLNKTLHNSVYIGSLNTAKTTFRGMATYDSLRRQCRTLESVLDAKLTSYSRLASTIGREQGDVEASGSSERWRDLEEEVEGLLEKVSVLPHDIDCEGAYLIACSCKKQMTRCRRC